MNRLSQSGTLLEERETEIKMKNEDEEKDGRKKKKIEERID